MTGVSTGVRPEDERNPLVGVSSEGGPAPLRGPSPADRSIDTDTPEAYRSDMALSDILDALSQRSFGRTKAEAHADVSCIRCSKPVVLGAMSRRDAAEYMISGICPECFTVLFPDDD